jgi:phosphate transport system permease protein
VQLSTLLLILIAMAVISFMLGRRRSIAVAGGYGSIRKLHSLPKYYGYYVAIWCGLPGVLLILLWLSVSESLIMSQVIASLPSELREASLLMSSGVPTWLWLPSFTAACKPRRGGSCRV